MRAVVTNFGLSQHFPTCDGNVFLSAKSTREIEISKRALGELSKFKFIKVESTEEPEKPAVVPPIEPSHDDLSTLKLPALRALAKGKGIAGAARMKKQELLDILAKENNDG